MLKEILYNPLVGNTVKFLSTAERSGGTRTEIEIELAAGGGIPMHYHNNFSETFTICDGTLGLELSGGRKLYLKRGELITIPRRTPHRFFNDSSSPVTFRERISPADSGFEHSLRIAYGLVNDGLTNRSSIPRNPYHLAILLKMGDSNLPGILSLIKPLVTMLFRQAKRKQIDKKLLLKYCER